MQYDPYIEMIARALCEAGNHKWPSTDGYNDRAEKESFRKMAIAAVSAMINPPEYVLDAGDQALIQMQGTRTIYNTMLESVLERNRPRKFERDEGPREVRLPRKGVNLG